VTPEIAETIGLKTPSGALVANVTPNSPSAKAGLKLSDLIVAIDGQVVDDPNAFDYRFTTHELGGKVELGVVRGGKESKVAVALETAPELPRDEIVIEARSPFTGAKVANLSPALADELRLDSSTEGVVVVDIADGTLAQQFGFQRGDVLLGVNGAKIAKTADLQKAAQAFPDSVEVQFNLVMLDRDEGRLGDALKRANEILKKTEKPNGRYSEADKQNRRTDTSRLPGVRRARRASTGRSSKPISRPSTRNTTPPRCGPWICSSRENWTPW